MENNFKIPSDLSNMEQMKGFANALTAFFEQLVILNKSIESLAKDTNITKEYFTTVNGFQKDLKKIQEEILEEVLYQTNIDKVEILTKIDTSSQLMSKSIFNKILALGLSTVGVVGLVFYAVQNFLLKSSIQEIIQEVLKNVK